MDSVGKMQELRSWSADYALHNTAKSRLTDRLTDRLTVRPPVITKASPRANEANSFFDHRALIIYSTRTIKRFPHKAFKAFFETGSKASIQPQHAVYKALT